jgi:hypothetical protein
MRFRDKWPQRHHFWVLAVFFRRGLNTRNPAWRGVQRLLEIEESQFWNFEVAEREGFEPSIRD